MGPSHGGPQNLCQASQAKPMFHLWIPVFHPSFSSQFQNMNKLNFDIGRHRCIMRSQDSIKKWCMVVEI